MIRPPRPDELAQIQAVERAAATLFAPGRIPEPDSVHDLDELAQALEGGRLWVAAQGNRIAGFVLTSPYEHDLHVDELDVDPTLSRRGIGAALLRHVARQARSLQLRRLTLTTFAEVPWNGPYYERLGFVRLEPGELSARLRSTLREEAASGLSNRIAMALPVEPPA